MKPPQRRCLKCGEVHWPNDPCKRDGRGPVSLGVRPKPRPPTLAGGAVVTMAPKPRSVVVMKSRAKRPEKYREYQRELMRKRRAKEKVET